MQECGTPLPTRDLDGAPATCEEMLNRLNSGFQKWQVITKSNAYEEAQARANNGYPTIALEKNMSLWYTQTATVSSLPAKIW